MSIYGVSAPVVQSNYDRSSELKAFDATKAGVKGLVDSGIQKIPKIFIQPPEMLEENSGTNNTSFSIPVIDLSYVNRDPTSRKEVIEKIQFACEKYGFFQVVNHGIPLNLMDDMLNGVRAFFEQDTEVKKKFYTRDLTQKVVYNTNFDFYGAPAANWRDSFFSVMAPNPPKPEDLPPTCREVQIEYSKQVLRLGTSLFELLSESLGLKSSHLNEIGCNEGLLVVCHYYPKCPEPQLTMGATQHTDEGFLTVLLQDHIPALQVLHQNQWIDVPPVRGALIINVANILQLITNDRFKSVEHRVVANSVGPRVSVACFFSTSVQPSTRSYKPIQELLSEDNPAKYRETTLQQFNEYYYSKGLDGISPLLHFQL
jgi:isopenicillin N synthase-like dioxygenase